MKFLDKFATIAVLDETSSTNAFMKEWILNEKLPEGLMLHTNSQTKGEGQQGNVWESEPLMNITASIYFSPTDLLPRKQFRLSIAAALGVYDFLSAYIDDGLSIKWPNDLYVHDRKIGGILIDNAIMHGQLQYSIWGTGININQRQFSSWIPNPTSLQLETGKQFSIEKLLPQLQNCLVNRYQNMDLHQRDEYLQHIYRREGYYEYNSHGISFVATFLGINALGHLILRTNQGDIREFVIKELQYII